MTTLQLVIGGLSLGFLACMVVYIAVAIRRSGEMERAEHQGHRVSPEPTRADASTRPGYTRPAASRSTGVSTHEARAAPSQDVRSVYWKEYVAQNPDEPVTYRARHIDGQGIPQWNPFAAEQSSAHRVRAARRQRRAYTPPSWDDHYTVLGVERDATAEQIERAYRRHAARIHPDRFFDDPIQRAEAEKKLKQLNSIMQVLRDPVRRAEYNVRLSLRERRYED